MECEGNCKVCGGVMGECTECEVVGGIWWVLSEGKCQ